MQERSGNDAGRWLAWLFVAFALGDLVYYVVTARFDPNPTIGVFATYALQVIPSVASVLLPAALLFRHPDATVRARTLLLGTILFAVAQGLQILANPLQFFFEAASPASQDLPTVVPMAELYNGFISVVLAVALLSIAAGLSQARRHDDRSGVPDPALRPVHDRARHRPQCPRDRDQRDRRALALARAGPLRRIGGAPAGRPDDRLVVPADRPGARLRMSDERPRSGWRLATFGVGLVVVGLLLFNFNGVLPALTGTAATVYAYATVIAYALGHISLVGAFLLGLPALDAEEDAEDAEDA